MIAVFWVVLGVVLLGGAVFMWMVAAGAALIRLEVDDETPNQANGSET